MTESSGEVVDSATVSSDLGQANESNTNNDKNLQNTIVSIKIIKTAGRAGSTSIYATPDSLIFNPGIRTVKEQNPFKKAIKVADWNTLVSGINLDVLEQTEDGEHRGVYDGPDAITVISTREKDYTFFNVTDEKGAAQINKLRRLLNEMLASEK